MRSVLPNTHDSTTGARANTSLLFVSLLFFMSTTTPHFTTKDSGLRQDFATGARRDVETGKPKYSTLSPTWLKKLVLAAEETPDCRLDLLPIEGLVRLAALYGRGAKKYGEGNFEKGIPFKRVWDSAARHLFQYAEGDRSEDHAAAVAWNFFALMFYEAKIAAGELPRSLDDLQVLSSSSEAKASEEILELVDPVAEVMAEIKRTPMMREGPAPGATA